MGENKTIVCPECGKSNVEIQCLVWAEMLDDGEKNILEETLEVDPNSSSVCRCCGYTGKAGDFEGTPVPNGYLEIKGKEKGVADV
jgi:NMD protein affecting ribosome stability and mRNA decay